jgi:hypothetical protein
MIDGNTKKLLNRVLHFLKDMPKTSNSKIMLENELEAVLGIEKTKEEERVLVGYLAVKMGYKCFLPMEIGTPIYELNGFYYIDHVHETSGKVESAKYYASSFSEDKINYLLNETKSN